MFARAKALFLIAPFLFSVSCVHYSLNKNYAGPKQIPAELAERYSYDKPSGEYVEKVLEEKEKYTIKRIQLPASPSSYAGGDSAKQRTILIDYYEVKGLERTPVVIVLPILGGNNSESKIFSSYFAEHGLSALMVHRDQKQKESANFMGLEPSMRDMVVDHRLVIDWIATRAELDSSKIGVFGVSMGGIKAALLLGLDQRIKAGVIALAGGDLPYILLHSKEKGIIERVDAVLKERGLTRRQLQAILKANLRTDPIRFAEYVDARKVLVVRALFDKVVPTKKQRELAEAMGGPEQINIFSGHYTSIAYIFYVRIVSLDFFRNKFQGK